MIGRTRFRECDDVWMSHECGDERGHEKGEMRLEMIEHVMNVMTKGTD